jgi:hypothetical protein
VVRSRPLLRTIASAIFSHVSFGVPHTRSTISGV